VRVFESGAGANLVQAELFPDISIGDAPAAEEAAAPAAAPGDAAPPAPGAPPGPTPAPAGGAHS